MADGEDRFGLVGRLWDSVRAFFTAQWEDVWSKWVETVPKTLDGIGEKLESGFQKIDDPLWESVIDFYRKQGYLTPVMEKFLADMKNLPVGSSFIMFILVNIFILGSYINIVQDSVSATMAFKYNAETRHNLADIQTLIKSAFVAPEKTGEIRGHLAKMGLGEEQIDFLFLSQYALYDPNTCRELFLRGVIDDNKLFERMRELGFTDTRIKEMMQAWEVIPGPGDLFHLVAKEAFEPDMIAKIGLGDEFPDEQLPWLQKQGINEYWARRYWYAHWDQPSIQMGFEMLHRGVIDNEELDMLFRAQEIPPFWRDKLTEIAYLPYTRVDTRRMYDEDVITIQEVYRSYLDQGYSEEKAYNLTKWTHAQKNPEEKNLTAGQVLDAFTERIIDRSEARSLLIDLGYSEARVEFILVGREYDMERAFQKKQIQVIKEKYINRLIDRFEAMRDINQMDLPSKQVNLLFEEWNLEIFKDKKIPSKTDLEKFLKKKIITKETYMEEMDKLGYSKKYADWYFRATTT